MNMYLYTDALTSRPKKPKKSVAACGVVARHVMWTITGNSLMAHRWIVKQEYVVEPETIHVE
jgi:hypothetical protein